MSLINCPDCEKQISSNAHKCSFCGYKAPTTFLGNLLLVASILLGSFGIINWLLLL
ncbi:zinc ribbon domain-containing protein [Colwellia polaris]|uniref:zinc ribbon domain-containing protein n=1 Tax=Colwellia polaris TaxID=326537 RepID=UPI000A170498